MNKKGQGAQPINWIYIMVAGAIILLFFVGIVIRQKAVSTQRLSAEISQKLGSIFTSAQLSEETTNIIEIPQISLNFVCDEDGYSEFNIDNSPSGVETPFEPIFSLTNLETGDFILWSVTFEMPFTIGNLLLVSAPNVRTIIVSDDSDPVSLEIREDIEDEFPEQINVDFIPVNDYGIIAHEGDNRVRFVFLGNTLETVGGRLSPSFYRLDDTEVSAVSIKSNTVDFYTKTGQIFSLEKRGVPLLPSLKPRNPALLAAIFSGSAQLYECNMRKVMNRFFMVAQVYEKRAQRLLDHYDENNLLTCKFTLAPSLVTGCDEQTLSCLVELAEECSSTYDQECFKIWEQAQGVAATNNCLQGKTAACSDRTGCGNIY